MKRLLARTVDFSQLYTPCIRPIEHLSSSKVLARTGALPISRHSVWITTQTSSAAPSVRAYNTRRLAAHSPALRDMSSYTFSLDKMRPAPSSDSREPLVLVSCGSFSPITYLHLRMFEMCKDWVKNNTRFDVVAGYLSPVSDAYKKAGLVSANHRIEMCRLAVQQSSWIMVDDWEAIKEEYTRTALVLDHFEHEINEVRGGVETGSGKRKAKIALMSGADLLDTMSDPGVWAHEDLDHILGRYGAFIIERNGTDMDAALRALETWRTNIYPIPQLIQNDVSSTKIRNFLRKDMSIRYLIPEGALQYIDERGLFKDESPQRPVDEQPSSTSSVPNGSVIDGHVESVVTS
ncbi:MAG: hypothetical protein M1828_000611 [Chrysothrix sp. TS-e1954]|nr:MAG: hypothetical protein M1828_000611 [Chrysothrix sp. TS-e1954]